jgi:hypothetical protein
MKLIYPKKKPLLLLLPLFLFILNSCIGIQADIQMRRDGSGRITLEYRFSRMAESIGRLDGNESHPVIPAGRTDWERTAARITGMTLVSFSSREKAQDIVNKVTLEFKNTDALLKFLDPFGKRSSLSRENGLNKLHITLNEPLPPEVNPDLIDLMKQACAGYKFRISFSARGKSAMAFTDGAGTAVNSPAQAEVVSSGKKVSLSIGMPEILSIADGLGVSIEWKDR